MNSHAPAAFEATYGDWRLVKGRKVVQIVLEVPMEDADHAYQVLGGMPNPGAGVWLAVARMAGKSRLIVPIENMTAQQAGIRCNEPKFRSFLLFKCPETSEAILADDSPEQAAEVLRQYFNVKSRKDIKPNEWGQFENEYQLWLRA